MERILVTGGLGRLGRPLLKALQKRGLEIRALKHPNDASPSHLPPHLEIVEGDIADANSLKGIAHGMDAVLHAAAILQAKDSIQFDRINHLGTVNLLKECEASRVRHFVLVSSISVTYPRLSAYALSKQQAELALALSSLPMKTVVRPTLIYDDDGGASEFAALVRYIARFPITVLPHGGRALKRPVHAEDAAECLSQIPLSPAAIGKTYALAGSEVLSLREMAARISTGLKLTRPFVGLPKTLAMAGAWGGQILLPGRLLGLQGLLGLLQDAAPDIRDLATDFNFRPRPFQPNPTALKKAVTQ